MFTEIRETLNDGMEDLALLSMKTVHENPTAISGQQK